MTTGLFMVVCLSGQYLRLSSRDHCSRLSRHHAQDSGWWTSYYSGLFWSAPALSWIVYVLITLPFGEYRGIDGSTDAEGELQPAIL